MKFVSAKYEKMKEIRCLFRTEYEIWHMNSWLNLNNNIPLKLLIWHLIMLAGEFVKCNDGRFFLLSGWWNASVRSKYSTIIGWFIMYRGFLITLTTIVIDMIITNIFINKNNNNNDCGYNCYWHGQFLSMSSFVHINWDTPLQNAINCISQTSSNFVDWASVLFDEDVNSQATLAVQQARSWLDLLSSDL